MNKTSKEATFTIRPSADGDLRFVVPIDTVTIEPLGSRRLPLFVSAPSTQASGKRIVVRVETIGGAKDATAVFLGGQP